LTNVARHAAATEVKVRLARKDGGLILEVHDNGRGFAPDKLSSEGSLGIVGMQERALVLGGELMIISAPGQGTTVRVWMPMASALKGNYHD
jgi:signal transduction histidine kinase